MRISGVVVWYNPTLKEVKNIESYLEQLDNLFIVDNSKISNLWLLKELMSSKIKYIPNFENLGIAKALNIGCKKAIEKNSEWILTMDQDSKFNNNFDVFLEKILEKNEKNIAIYAPKTSFKEKCGYVDKVITSGNIINLRCYSDMEGFDEKFFIDEVDFDFNVKLIKKGYTIYKFDEIVMSHKLGNTKSLILFGKKIFSTMNHGHIRKYYMTRNRFEMKKRYPELKKEYYKIIMRDFIKMILIEEKKVLKIKYCIKGYLDYRKQKFGKIKV